MIHKLGFCWCGTAHVTIADIPECQRPLMTEQELLAFQLDLAARRRARDVLATYLQPEEIGPSSVSGEADT
jgi:hypothetical protein